MEDWQRSLAESVVTEKDLAKYFNINPDEIREIIKEYPMRIPKYYLNLIEKPGDPIWLQAVPDVREIQDTGCPDDPLHEDVDSPVPNLVHRYPDRVLFLVTFQCPMYCRFCTRKRGVGHPGFVDRHAFDKAIQYIAEHEEIRDVILSGGDPLILTDDKLERIIAPLREIPHLDIIRIGTKVPCTFPERITQSLCDMLKKYHPLFINVHFNHPRELTPQAKKACEMLADAGIPLGNQTVLLKGVNDDPEVMSALMKGLLKMRVKPYYIYQADLTKGTNHFRTKVEVGLKIMRALRGYTSGLAVPYFVIDAPGGGGKIPILPDSIVGYDEQTGDYLLRNYEGKIFRYPEAGVEVQISPENQIPADWIA
jgi:lysine 2,3-aminomutase